MSDVLRVRDHTQPCKHGYTNEHIASSLLEDDDRERTMWSCPGGREIVLRELYFPVDAWQEVDDDE